MLFKRKIYNQLVQWKKTSNGKTALLIEGARRVGKSTIAEEFAKNEYKTHLLIDFSKTGIQVKNIFCNHLDNIDLFYQLLQVQTGVRLEIGNSLLIFDEVQKFPRAREAVKALVADGRCHILETGSLINIRENVSAIVIPSEEESISMYPMDFEEFLLACGEEPMLAYIRNCFQQKVPLEDSLHRKAILLIKQYMIVGGMPQSVAAYLENSLDFYEADLVKRSILDLYRKDIMKADRRYRTKVAAIYEQIPGFLSKHEKTVVLNEIEKSARYSGLADSFFWLKDAMIANLCLICRDPNIGLALNEDSTQLKCYMGDTGLLLSHTFSPKEIQDDELYKKLMNGRLAINQGMFFENLVAQMLHANGHDLYFYNHYSPEKHRNDIEIDFLLSNGSKTNFHILPIEVKSSKNYTTTSLTDFRERFKKRISISYVIHPKNLKEENGILYIPVYMTFLLH
ncbi:MAG: AAA family ATPase [Lachnospiraceae bacterium]|nr:AAA family ATPase [Lachnospiraceae bacterium]